MLLHAPSESEAQACKNEACLSDFGPRASATLLVAPGDLTKNGLRVRVVGFQGFGVFGFRVERRRGMVWCSYSAKPGSCEVGFFRGTCRPFIEGPAQVALREGRN